MIDPEKFDVMERVAEKLFRGGVFSAEVKSADTAFAIILAGDEMGYEPMAAARAIALVKGKVSLSADAMIGLVKRSAQCESWHVVSTTATECTITTKRVGDDTATTLTYTIAMAQRAGLTGSQTWRSHPEAMLRARCGAALARAVYPDVCGGLYDPDEADEIRSHDRGASRSEPKASAKKPEATESEARAEEPACPPALAAFYAGLPGLAGPSAGALLWHEHRAALNAAEGNDRPAAWDALVKRVVRFGGGVASVTAAKNFLKSELAALSPKPAAAVEPQPVAAPVEAPAPEVAPVEASPEPAAAPFVEQLARCGTLDAVATLWLAAREDIAQGSKADQAAAWGAAVERLAVIQHCAPSKALGVLLSKRIKILAGEEPDPNGPKGSATHDGAQLSDAHGSGEASGTVVGHACHDNGRFSVADPRWPASVPFPVIISLDGTWHRPLTTLECAALQSFPVMVDGQPLTLDGKSNSAWRVRIGDAVPPDGAKPIAMQMLLTLLHADAGSFVLSSGGAVWVDGPSREAVLQ